MDEFKEAVDFSSNLLKDLIEPTDTITVTRSQKKKLEAFIVSYSMVQGVEGVSEVVSNLWNDFIVVEDLSTKGDPYFTGGSWEYPNKEGDE